MKEIEIIIPELEAIPDRIPRKPWSDWEENVLKHYFGRKPNEAIGRVLGRTAPAVQEKARNMGLKLHPEEDTE